MKAVCTALPGRRRTLSGKQVNRLIMPTNGTLMSRFLIDETFGRFSLYPVQCAPVFVDLSIKFVSRDLQRMYSEVCKKVRT